ncbi:MAG: phosphatase PAP2 family protein [Clostridia bacterium]
MNKKKVALIVVPIILFCMLALCVKADLSIEFENWVYSEAVEHMSPVVTNIVKFITRLGNASSIILFCFVLLIIPYTRHKYGMPVSISVIISGIFTIVLKKAFVRQRPDILRLVTESTYSFPSGHAMINGAMYIMIILLVLKYVKSKKIKTALISLCSFLIVSIGFSRVYLGVHYISDIIGGWLLGFVVAFVIYIIWKNRVIDKEEL